MADLIDRGALLAHFAELKDKSDTLRDKLYLDGVMAVIDVAPTVDAAPVVHGRWVDPQPNEDGNVNCHCSNCYAGETHHPKIDVPYCWKCGARIDADAPERAGKDGRDV